MNWPVIAVGLAAILSGCAQMSVRVQVFDAQYASTGPFLAEEVRYSLQKALALVADTGGLNEFETASVGIAKESIRKLIQAGIAPMTGELDRDVEKEIRSLVGDVRGKYEGFIRDAEVGLWSRKPDPGYSQDHRLLLAIEKYADAERSRRNLLQQVKSKILAWLDSLSPAIPGEGAGAKAVKGRGGNATKESKHSQLTDGGPLSDKGLKGSISELASNQIGKAWATFVGGARNSVFADPKTSLIISAPCHAWRGLYNEVYGWGTFGNTDIAVKMEKVADFTLKGIRTDSTKVTQASLSGLTAAARVMAAAYGVPLAARGEGDSSSGSREMSDADPEQFRLDAELKLQMQRAAMADILGAIAREASEIESTGSGAEGKRTAAIKRIKDVFNANRPDLSPTTGEALSGGPAHR